MLIESVREAEMFWLNATNIALGLVVLVCAGVIAVSVVRAIWARMRTMSEIEQDMQQFNQAGDTHAFQVPGLGMTMADGGEPVRKRNKKGR